MSTSTGRTVMVQGRIVWVNGDLFKGEDKRDQNTKQIKLDDQGKPIKGYGFGLAVPKSVFSQTGQGQPGEIWAAIQAEAASLYPSGNIPPAFAYKFKDGDGVDHNGVSFTQREGYAGHIVFALTTQIPIKFFKYEGGNNILVNEGIKCGDYVNVQVNVKAHTAEGQSKPGMYLNPMAVQLVGYGKEIINTPSGDQIFGTTAPPVPQGASATPMAPQGFPGQQPQGFPGQQPQGFPGAAMPQQPMTPQGFPNSAPLEPHYGILPAAHQPQQPMAPQGFPGQQPQGFPGAAMPQQPMTPQGFPGAAMPQQPMTPQGFPGFPGMPGAR